MERSVTLGVGQRRSRLGTRQEGLGLRLLEVAKLYQGWENSLPTVCQAKTLQQQWGPAAPARGP